jgi:hypothetical protein
VPRRYRLRQDVAKGASTFAGATAAANPLEIDWIVVISGEFFADTDFPPAEIHQAASNPPPLQIRIAGLIYKFGAAAANAWVNDPSAVERCHVSVPGKIKFVGLSGGEATACVFDDALAWWNILECEDGSLSVAGCDGDF